MNAYIASEDLYLSSDYNSKQWAVVIGVPKITDSNIFFLNDTSTLMFDIINGTTHSEPVYNPKFGIAGQPSRTVNIIPIGNNNHIKGYSFDEGMHFKQFLSNPIQFDVLEIVVHHPGGDRKHYESVEEFLIADTHNATPFFVLGYKGEEYMINYRFISLL